MSTIATAVRNTLGRTVIGTALVLLAITAHAFPIAAPGTDGLKVIVSGTNHVIATYQGNSAAYSNDLLLNGTFIFNNHATPLGTTVDLGSFPVGTELVFQLYVNNTGYSYYTGPASRNPDSHTHARVQAGWMTDTTLVSFEDLYNGPFDFNDLSFSFTNTTAGSTTVPEPDPLMLMLAGLGLVALMVRLRKA